MCLLHSMFLCYNPSERKAFSVNSSIMSVHLLLLSFQTFPFKEMLTDLIRISLIIVVSPPTFQVKLKGISSSGHSPEALYVWFIHLRTTFQDAVNVFSSN